MAFAAVLTALGYYIILRRFCQGLLKIFLQGAATGGGSFPPLPPANPRLWLTSLPLPPPETAAAGEQARRGDSSPAGDSGGRRAGEAGQPPASARYVPAPVPPDGWGAGDRSPCGICSTCPGGEDHLKRRSSSPPVPPLLGCRHCSRQTISVGFAVNRRFNPGDARGEAPCMK